MALTHGRDLTTHLTQRRDSVPLIVACAKQVECFMLGAGQFGR